jgi:hypothetical protein
MFSNEMVTVNVQKRPNYCIKFSEINSLFNKNICFYKENSERQLGSVEDCKGREGEGDGCRILLHARTE